MMNPEVEGIEQFIRKIIESCSKDPEKTPDAETSQEIATVDNSDIIFEPYKKLCQPRFEIS